MRTVHLQTYSRNTRADSRAQPSLNAFITVFESEAWPAKVLDEELREGSIARTFMVFRFPSRI